MTPEPQLFAADYNSRSSAIPPEAEEAARQAPRLEHPARTFLPTVDDRMLDVYVRASNPEAVADRLSLVQYYQGLDQFDRVKTIVKEILQVHPQFTTEMALDVFRMASEMPEEIESEVTLNFKLAGLP